MPRQGRELIRPNRPQAPIEPEEELCRSRGRSPPAVQTSMASTSSSSTSSQPASLTCGIVQVPSKRRRFLLRPVQTHHKNKGVLRGRQPVSFLAFAGRFVLDVQVNRAVPVGLQLVALAQCVPVNGIRDEEIARVVHSQRPKAVNGGISPFLKCMTYLFAPLYFLRTSGPSDVG